MANSNNLQQAIRRLELVVALCMVLIAVTLYTALGSMALSFTVFTAVPLAMAGGVFAIVLRGNPFSVSAAVRFIAVFWRRSLQRARPHSFYQAPTE